MTAEDKPSTVPVTVALRRPSKTPAVFLLGSFTEPAWQPVELDAKPVTTDDKAGEGDDEPTEIEYEFSTRIELPEGSHKYRFRLGSDDTWVYNEDVDQGR
jgi:hypothetical protein